ncbi:MAG: IS3 family transposase [Holosporaceae bacterium]|nr:IS3 family transposase [Holosporaceae bacterium]
MREESWTKNFPTASIKNMNNELQKYVEKYNNFRPHNRLHGMTPMEYIRLRSGDLFTVSHLMNSHIF